MKFYNKIIYSFFFVFLIVFFIVVCLSINHEKTINISYAEDNVSDNISISDILDNITFSYLDKIYHIKSKDCEFSDIQKKICGDFYKRVDTLNFAMLNGFEIEKAFQYTFPELVKTIDDIYNQTTILPTDAEIEVVKNSAKTIIRNSKNGIKIDKKRLFVEIFNIFNKKLKKIIFKFFQL